MSFQRVLRASSLRFPILFSLVIISVACSNAIAAPQDVNNALFRLLPPKTVAAIVVSEFPLALQQRLKETTNRAVAMDDMATHFGIDLKLLARAAKGQLMRGLAAASENRIADFVVAPIEGETAKILLGRAQATFNALRATRTAVSLDSTQAALYTVKENESSRRAIVHVVCKGYLVLADDQNVALTIVQRLNAAGTGKATPPRGLREILTKISLHPKKSQLGMICYVDPWTWEMERAANGKENDSASRLAHARRHGMTGIVALGGSVVFLKDNRQVVESFVYAPAPRKSSLKIFHHLRSAKDLEFADWVPRDVDDVELMHLDVSQAAKNLNVLYDDLFADGIEGTYEQVLGDLKSELQIDLTKNLFSLLGPRVCVARMPRGKKSYQPTIYAFETSSPRRVAQVFRQLMKDDPEAKSHRVEGFEEPLWHAPPINKEGEDFVLMVARGYAFHSNDAQFLRKVLATDPAASIGREPDFTKAHKSILGFYSQGPCFLMANTNKHVASQQDKPAKNTKPATLLGLVFDRVETLDTDEKGLQGILPQVVPYAAKRRLVIGFPESDGWRIVSLEF